MKKAKIGRPALSEKQYRGEHVFCRVTKDEAKEIKAAATRANKKKSDWVRDTLLTAARASNQTPPQP
jgi:uncharacterized protein (DUF1778 family)